MSTNPAKLVTGLVHKCEYRLVFADIDRRPDNSHRGQIARRIDDILGAFSVSEIRVSCDANTGALVIVAYVNVPLDTSIAAIDEKGEALIAAWNTGTHTTA